VSEGEHRAVIDGLVAVAVDQRVDVDDPGGRRPQPGDRADPGLTPPDRRRIDELDVTRSVGERLAMDRLELSDLGVIGGDQDLAAAPVRQPEPRAALVQLIATGDAQPRLEAAGRIVQAGVDDAAVA
jgi:hypothetical protein